jgi:hypothetical protein
MATVPALTTTYTLEQAEEDIAQLRGQVDLSNEAQTISDGAVVPNTPAASGVTLYSAAAQLNYASFDGNDYNTGRLTALFTGTSQTINSTSMVNVNGLTVPVAAGTYKFRSFIPLVTNGSGAAGAPAFKLQGPAFSSGGYILSGMTNGSTGVARYDNTSGFNFAMNGPGLTATSGLATVVWIEGFCVFTASGTLLVQAALSGAGTSQYVVAVGAYLELSPIT